MTRSRWALWCAASAAAACTLAAQAVPGLAAPAATHNRAAAPSDAQGPRIGLIAIQKSLTVRPGFRSRVFVDPGVYVESRGSALRFDVRLPRYGGPMTLTQVIRLPDGVTERRPLPSTFLRHWIGLRHFLRITIVNKSGKTVGSRVSSFCPNVFDPQRATLNSPAHSPYPFTCGFNPFTKGMVWGIQRGWGVNPFEFGAPSFRLRLGTYRLTVTITAAYRRLLHIPAAGAVVHLKLSVVKRTRRVGKAAPGRHSRRAGPLAPLPNVPYLASPPRSVLPDLVALPARSIRVVHMSNGKTNPGTDQLTFGATIWIGGNSPLDVEGFRSGTTPVMKAYQYFYRHGHVVGRARAGTMGFDGRRGHHHWHFQQFAQYRLLNSTKSVALHSKKVGFCIAPTDPIDLALPAAAWQTTFTGFFGACGSPTALWVREMLPVGWGDTYFQFVAGQSFDITNLPNGKYFIEVIANPLRLLHESNTRNDTSLREVILGGTPGHRTVKVPAWHGIDPEG